MKTNMDNSIDEARLRNLIGSLPQAEVSPWFTRRVLNRLPDRRKKIAGRIEYVVYLVALLWLLFIGITCMRGDISDGVTVRDMINYLAWLSIVGGLVYALIEPRIYAAALKKDHRTRDI